MKKLSGAVRPKFAVPGVQHTERELKATKGIDSEILVTEMRGKIEAIHYAKRKLLRTWNVRQA